MKKIFVSLAAIFFVFFFLPFKVFAANEFATSYDVTYDVGTDGITQVTQKVSLKNLTSQYYASNFTLTIGSTTLTDVSAIDDGGVMDTKVEAKENKTSITVKFNQQVVGIDKQQVFTLKFKSRDFSVAIGKTWEVNLPKIPDADNISAYNLILSVPVTFGDPTSIFPKPKAESQNYDKLFFTFNKDQLEKNGISVNFGSTQVFDFNLKYHLDNDSLFPVVTSVTLPPDTLYQDIEITRIIPEPLNVTIDEDGNYLAWYKLPRRSKLDVAAAGSAKLYISPKDKASQSLSAVKTQSLTKTDQYWETVNPAIGTALKEIFKGFTPRTNGEKANLIYRYVVDTLKYDTSRINGNNIERLGAVTALNNPNSAVCMEFTDLFIALARAANIPARELDGYAYSQNKALRPLSLSGYKDSQSASRDLLHAWPEYFDEVKGWVMVDPTWENTSGGVDYFNKFDLNHLVLAIRGTSSKIPYTSDDVKVSLSSEDFSVKPHAEISIDMPDTLWAGFPGEATINISNQGNSVLKPNVLSLKTGKLKIVDSNLVTLGAIPPFGSTTYQVNLRTQDLLQNFNDKLEASFSGQKIEKEIQIKPFFYFMPLLYGLIGLGVFILGIYITILIVHYSKRKSTQEIV